MGDLYRSVEALRMTRSSEEFTMRRDIMKLKQRVLPFIRNTPSLLLFQIISSLFLLLITEGLSLVSGLLLGLEGKVTISSGDFAFLFTGWRGWLLIILGITTLLLYVAIDVNALLIYSNKLLEGEKASVWRCFAEGILSLRKYLNPRGLFIILYATLLSPVLGLGFSISLTSSLYIPRFISSVIENNPLLLSGLILLTLAMTVISVIYTFILHGALLRGQTMKEAGIASRKLIKSHWKNFLWEMFRFILTELAILVIGFVALFLLPLLLSVLLPIPEQVQQFVIIFFGFVFALYLMIFQLLLSPFLLTKTITLYKKYNGDEEQAYRRQPHPAVRVLIPVISALTVVLIAFVSILTVVYFDEAFPADIKPQIVAHRAGGSEAPENTVKGLEVASSLKAAGGEIDIQRTADGRYVVNHDNTFARVAGDSRASYEMTLEQIKQLRVDGEPVATLEEMLEASRGKLTLFVELKGETADRQMADDAVRIIKEMNMEKQTVIISLKYDILEYVEEKYPEMETGYLAFFSFGNIENTPFDYLALEEEIATDGAIDAIHQKNKKIMVWTVNDEDDIESFLLSDADMLITDAVSVSQNKKEALLLRGPHERMIDAVFKLLF